MNKIIKPILFAFVLLISLQTKAQKQNFELETTYMNCMYGIFEDEGVKLKELIKNAEQQLIEAKLLKDTSGESYIALFKNIKQAVDGRIPSFEISSHVITGMNNNKKVKEYMSCMNGMMQSEAFKDSKISAIVKLSSSGTTNPEITTLANKLLTIFEAKDFEHDFYKYLTFSLIDKFNNYGKNSGAVTQEKKG